MPWRARWCGAWQHPEREYGAYRFRREFEVVTVPVALPVRVSADQRYRLFVNGTLVGEGPAVGDLLHWRYEEYDLAPHLKAGANTVEAEVWWLGRYAPAAHQTYRLAFVLEGEGLDTPDGWQVRHEPWRTFEMMHDGVGPFYIDVGPGEIVQGGADTTADWRKPNEIGAALMRGEWYGNSPWWLTPRPIPVLDRKAAEPSRVYTGPTGFRSEAGSPPWRVEPGKPLVLDMGGLVHGSFAATLHGPKGTKVEAAYAEGPWGEGGKLHRDDIQHGRVTGYQDLFVLGEGTGRFAPHGVRTWRYLELRSDQAVEVLAAEAHEVGYPYEVGSKFECDDPFVADLWEVGIRTLRLCAGETYFDCPYYEQLQYVGDTRIQALCQTYLSRDRRLARQAADQYLWSQDITGMVASCYPARVRQVIPGFALWWVAMIADRLLYDAEPPPPSWIEGAARAVAGFERLLTEPEGRQQWPFMDWCAGWPAGVPPTGLGAPEHALLLELARDALVLLQGRPPSQSDPGHANAASEHCRALRALVCRGRGLQEPPWPSQWPEGAARCTPYFLYYSHLAQVEADYLSLLSPWRAMLERGLSTFAETAEPTRSDCHAWSAHPVLGLLQTVAGVSSAAPGWAKARLAPRPGLLKKFRAVVAHPAGDLTVELGPGGLEVVSPVPFELSWRGRTAELGAGRHTLGD